MKSTVNAGAVTFSAGSRVKVGAVGAPSSSLAYMGLLGDSVTFNVEQSVRQKMDRYPEVVVAESIQGQSARLEFTIREWTRLNIMRSLGLEAADVTDVAGGDQSMSEVRSLTNGLSLASYPVKGGEQVTLRSEDGQTTYSEGSDFFVVERDLEGRTLVVRNASGAIPENASVELSYTYVSKARTEMPIGRRAKVAYYTLEIEEEYTNGSSTSLRMHRARLGLSGNLTMQGAENSADLPMVAQALFDPTQDELARLVFTDVERDR